MRLFDTHARVVAKSALFRFPLRGKLYTLPCSSFPRKIIS